jgi:hypothetical protein
MKKSLLIVFSLLFLASVYAQERIAGPAKVLTGIRTSISVTDMDGTTTTATDLVESILGPGISYSNISFTGLSGSPASAGLFTGGTIAGLSFESGIMLSSGYVSNAIGPNVSGNITADLQLAGDADLNTLIPGYTTFDATILEFDFTLPADSIYIQFIFGSDEYNEWVGSAYNDVFAFFLDGTNIAVVPGTTTPVSVNNVNNGANSSYYNDNTGAAFDLECDGFTTALDGTFPLDLLLTTHHIKLAIADAGDHILDSWVFIRASSFSIPIEVDLGPDVGICDGDYATLDAGNPGYEFLWSTGATTQTIDVYHEGEYWVEVSYLGNFEYDAIYVTVYPLPVAYAGSDVTIYIGYPPLSTQLQASGGVTYSWSPATGLSDPNIYNPIAQPGVTTTYTVTVTDENGCTDTDDVTVTVMDIRCGKNLDKVLVCHLPPGNTGNPQTICIAAPAVPAHLAHGDYLGPCATDKSLPASNIVEITGTNVSIYPNPAEGVFTIEIEQEYDASVSILVTDIVGRSISKIYQGELTAGNHIFTWDMTGMERSVYFLQVISPESTQSFKLMTK